MRFCNLANIITFKREQEMRVTDRAPTYYQTQWYD